jgi:hypothetical protein
VSRTTTGVPELSAREQKSVVLSERGDGKEREVQWGQTAVVAMLRLGVDHAVRARAKEAAAGKLCAWSAERPGRAPAVREPVEPAPTVQDGEVAVGEAPTDRRARRKERDWRKERGTPLGVALANAAARTYSCSRGQRTTQGDRWEMRALAVLALVLLPGWASVREAVVSAWAVVAGVRPRE